MQDITVMTDKSDVGIPHVKYNLFDWNIVNNKHVTKNRIIIYPYLISVTKKTRTFLAFSNFIK